MRDNIDPIEEYCEQVSTAPPAYLHRLERQTHLRTLAPQMLSGPLQGRFLAMLSKLLRPRRILEVGTFTGYAALCLAEGLHPEGELHTIEGNPEILYLARQAFGDAGFQDRIHLHQGDALELIPQISGDFDLIFLDANKREYEAYYDLCISRLNPGGLLLADNVLWSGKVLEPEKDKDAALIDQFNRRVQSDERVESLLLPLRDGLLLVRKE